MPSLRRNTLTQYSMGEAEIAQAKSDHISPRSGRTLKMPGLTVDAAEKILNVVRSSGEEENLDPPEEDRLVSASIDQPEEDDLPILKLEPVMQESKRRDGADDQNPDQWIAVIDEDQEQSPADAKIPSRPGVLDVPPYRETQPALLDLPPHQPAKPSANISKRCLQISNKVRLALAIGVGVVLGLVGTAIYNKYQGKQDSHIIDGKRN